MGVSSARPFPGQYRYALIIMYWQCNLGEVATSPERRTSRYAWNVGPKTGSFIRSESQVIMNLLM